MSLESAIHAIGTNDATLNAIISGRMYREVLPNGATLPALLYQIISGRPYLAHDGDTGVSRPRYQLSGLAADPGTAETLMDAVRTAYSGYRGTAGSRKIGGIIVDEMRSIPERETGTFRRIVDILIIDEGDV
jgi:hypothetical protein